MSTQRYYDAFSRGYDHYRGHAYHRLVDRLELGVLEPLVKDRAVLDVATGTGLLLMAMHEKARFAVGLDLSAGMVRHARRRGLRVVQGSAEALPFPDEVFDVVSCFKAFPHLAEPAAALGEMHRVCRPGGRVVVELYNPHSLRGLLRRLGPRRAISATLDEGQVVTRYDTPASLQRFLPSGLTLESVHGVRSVTPAGALLSWPGLGTVLSGVETWLSRRPRLWGLAGFLVVTLRKRDVP